MGKIRIKDVAKKAGVSISTVSRVLNNSAPVKEELRKKVLEAVKQLQYEPNLIARSLKTGETKTVGMILPDISNPFFATVFRGAEDYLRKEGYSLVMGSSDNDYTEEKRLLDFFILRKVDGIIFAGIENYNPKISEILLQNEKIVFFDRIYEGINSSYVVSDNVGGMKQLIKYLVETGHKSFCLINGNREAFSAAERYKGFKSALEEFGVKDYKCLFGQFTFESAYEMVRSLENLPDAIVCGNDIMAYGAIDALVSMGYSIPTDVSVTGFDDLFFNKYFKPPLTTVKQPQYEMGEEAAKLLIKLLRNEPHQNGVVLETTLIVRASTAPRK